MINLDINDIRSFIGSKDFYVSRDFYVNLGWNVTFDSDNLRVMELGGRYFYLQKYYHKDWCNNTMLHVSVQDVDAWYEHVQQRFEAHELYQIGRISDPPKDEGYGRVFHVWDPAGVLIHFAQFHEN